MTYEVVLTKDAGRDLEDIYRYIAEHDSPANADHDSPANADRVLDRLLETTDALRRHRGRGSCPEDLQSVGMAEYRQVFFKPYRVIYRVHARRVVIYVIADGRRDMQALLARRLLSP